MIPKIIHYCWFGHNPLPELAKKCIKSWKKYCPDYEIKEWNENNFDLNCCDYVKEAYEEKKWAFVSDYARFWILYKYGGIYFDTDVEIIKKIDDLVNKGSFMGYEKSRHINIRNINPGLGLGAVPGLNLYKEILDFYQTKHFKKANGEIDLTTVVVYTTDILRKHGLVYSNAIQYIENIYIYPSEYFCPMNYFTGKITITDNTRTIHHYSESWHNKNEKNMTKIERKLNTIFGLKLGAKLGWLYGWPYRIKTRAIKIGIKNTIKYYLKKFIKLVSRR